MERKVNKQLWLENVLKELYKIKSSYEDEDKDEANCSSHQKTKLNVHTPQINASTPQFNEFTPLITFPSRHKKKLPRKNLEEPTKEEHSVETVEKFWRFVEEFSLSKPFHGRRKNGFFRSLKLPSAAVDYTLLGIGNTITLRSRVILTSEKFTLPGSTEEEGEINSADQKEILAQKILNKIQKARVRKATDLIAQEVLEKSK